MNIADKRKLYAEIYRVLKPDGRFAFQEMAAGEAATSYFPLPRATDPGDSFLVSAREIHSLLGENGFVAELFEDTSDAHLSRTAADSAPAQLSLAVFVDNLAQKAGNARLTALGSRSARSRSARLSGSRGLCCRFSPSTYRFIARLPATLPRATRGGPA